MTDGLGFADLSLAELGLPDRFLFGRFSPFRINLLPDSRSCLKASRAAFSASDSGSLGALSVCFRLAHLGTFLPNHDESQERMIVPPPL
ncbi:hypothetical protein AC630_13175 [Bradyrhizobium sp. AS23.2]|nr:hypothetical protein AC630_13175 [Bradyrhizobium sp. AS23.2]